MSGKKSRKRTGKKTARKAKSPNKAVAGKKPAAPGIENSVTNIIAQAWELYRQNKITAVVESLMSIDDDAPFRDDREKADYYRLLAFSNATRGRLAEAETYARRGLELNEQDRDFHFTLAFVFVSFKNYEQTLKSAERFLELYEKRRDDAPETTRLSDDSLYLLYNFRGVAYKSQNNIESAVPAFKKAISLQPAYEHTYLNLADLYRHNGRYDEACEVVAQGLENCSQVQELRMMEKTLKNRATICACLIVKDEEELLPTCLESIRDWIDDIIVVDTGSTDRTVEIAKSYGAKVYFQEWEGSFSKARNFSLSKATCDWILYIDADEEFVRDDLPLLRQAIAQDKCRLVSVNIYNVKKETGECSSSLVFNRIFRSDAGFHFEGIVHNQLVYDDDEKVLNTNIRLKHYGYNLSPEKMKKKTKRSRTLLEQQLEKNPDFAFAHFNLAQLLLGVSPEDDPRVYELIIQHAKRTLELTDPSLAIHLMAHHQLATAYMNTGEITEAEKYALRALEIKPEYLDALMSLGHIYNTLKQPDKAEEYYKKYLEAQAVYVEHGLSEQLILIHIRARHVACYHLGLIKLYQGKYDEAEEHLLNALKELDPYLDAYLALAQIYLERREPDKAIVYIEKELAWHNHSALATMYKARHYVLKGHRDVAETLYLKAVDLTDDNPEILRQAGCFLVNQGQVNKAVSPLKRLVELQENYVDGWQYLAKAYYGDQQYDNAKTAYQRYLTFRPDDANAVNDLANCFFKLEEYEEAEIQFVQAMKANSDLAIAYRNLGLVKIRLGKLKDALTLLENYTGIAPDDLEIELAIGETYGRLERFGDAIPHFERLLAQQPNNIEALYGISECYRKLGYTDSAAIGYRQILKIDPKCDAARRQLEEIKTTETPA